MGFEQLAVLKQQLAKQAKEARAKEANAKDAKENEGKAKRAKVANEAKQAPAKPARPSQPRKPRPNGRSAASAASAETVDPVVRAIGKLQKRFPVAFPKKPAPKVPLKIGILADLLAHSQELGLNEAEIRDAVSTWCRGSRYWACLTDGAARLDLTGAGAGVVTARDAAFARRQASAAHRARRHDEGAPAPATAPGSEPPPPATAPGSEPPPPAAEESAPLG
jgi:ProP effector